MGRHDTALPVACRTAMRLSVTRPTRFLSACRHPASAACRCTAAIAAGRAQRAGIAAASGQIHRMRSTATSRWAWAARSRRQQCGRFLRTRASIPRPGVRAGLAGAPGGPGQDDPRRRFLPPRYRVSSPPVRAVLHRVGGRSLARTPRCAPRRRDQRVLPGPR